MYIGVANRYPMECKEHDRMRLHYERAFWTATTGAAYKAWVDVGTASHVTDDEIRKRLEGLTPIQKKAALDLLDTYIGNLPYLTNEE